MSDVSSVELTQSTLWRCVENSSLALDLSFRVDIVPVAAQLSPLFAEVLHFVADVRVPHGANDQQSEAKVGEHDGEHPAQGSQALEGLLVAVRSVLRRARPRASRPPLQVLKDVSGEISHDEDGGDDREDERAVNAAPRAPAFLSFQADVDAETNHNRQRDTEADVVPKRSGGGRHSTTDNSDHEGRPASGSDHGGNAH